MGPRALITIVSHNQFILGKRQGKFDPRSTPSILNMVRLGVHVSVAGGVDMAVSRAREKGCDAFQIFSSNPRKWISKTIPCESAERFLALQRQFDLSPVVDHMPYLPNLASSKEEVYAKSVEALARELERCQALGIPYLVTHLGSHLGRGQESGLARIVAALQTVFSLCDSDTVLLLENCAGTKNSMGGTFSDIAAVLESLPADRGRLGVCLDTCHLHAAGYDLQNPSGIAGDAGSVSGLHRAGVAYASSSQRLQGGHRIAFGSA